MLCCFAFLLCCCCLAFLSISWSDCSCTCTWKYTHCSQATLEVDKAIRDILVHTVHVQSRDQTNKTYNVPQISVHILHVHIHTCIHTTCTQTMYMYTYHIWICSEKPSIIRLCLRRWNSSFPSDEATAAPCKQASTVEGMKTMYTRCTCAVAFDVCLHVSKLCQEAKELRLHDIIVTNMSLCTH